MQQDQNKYPVFLIILVIVSTLVRAFLAATLDLGNDEVYYVLYAKYPDWSHFDHPPMVGLFIQLFSLNLFFNSEFAIRLSSLVFGAMNIWIIYMIGKQIKNPRTGFYSALLYVASIYASVISGVFILPDTPQSLFWLLSLWIMIRALPMDSGNTQANRLILLLGVTLGLGMLSKYTTVYLWLGAGLFFLFYRRDWLKKPSVYLSILISVLIASPILFWNYQNDWISFLFHENRVNSLGFEINTTYFFTELAGEIAYNNPVNFFLIVFALIAFVRNTYFMKQASLRILILSSVPLIATFLLIALNRNTLPHWNALAYTSLLLVAAAWLDQLKNTRLAKSLIAISLTLVTLILVVGILQVRYGLIPFTNSSVYEKIGENDPSLDLYGFHEVGEAFGKIVDRDRESHLMSAHSVLVGSKWFPLANYDFYAASPLKMKVFGVGKLEDLHKYAWINKQNGGLKKGTDAFYLTDSRYYQPPSAEIAACFEYIVPADTIQIGRGGRIAKRVFVFRLKNLLTLPDDPLKNLN